MNRLRAVRCVTVIFVCGIAIAGTVIAAPAAYAASTWYVAKSTNGGSDAHSCTAALPCATLAHTASIAASGDTINIGPGTFTTNVSLPRGMTIVGSGSAATFLDGGGTSTVISTAIPGSTTTISDLTVQNGNGTGISQTPGGISIATGTVTLTRVTVGPNVGTGIFNLSGVVLVSDSTIAGNTVGLADFDSAVDVSNSTFTRNGIGVRDTSCCSGFTDVTIAGNTGDGIVVSDTSRAEINASTIANNGGYGIHQGFFEGTPGSFGATVAGTIVSGNTSGNCSLHDDPGATFGDRGYNLEDDSSRTCTFLAANDVVGSDPKMGALMSNGGPTQTMRPGVGSAAIDAIPRATLGLCPSVDQRGLARPRGGACDIGAVEVATNSYVATAAGGGSDSNPCTQTQPCGSITTGLEAASNTGTLHVGAGTFNMTTDTGCVPQRDSGVSFCTTQPLVAQQVAVVGAGIGVTDLEGGATIGDGNPANQGKGASFADLTMQHGFLYVDDEGALALSTARIANGTGILVDGDLSITGSTIDNYGRICNCGVIANTSVSGSVIENGDGIEGNSDGCACLDVTSTTFRNNSVGISTTFSVDLVGNQFLNNGVGLELGGALYPSSISAVTLTGNGVGIDVHGSGATISKSTIMSSTGDGIDTESATYITNSAIAHNAGAGVSVTEHQGTGASGLAISNSTVVDNGGDGISLDGTLDFSTISQSTIAGNGGVGVNASTLADIDPGFSDSFVAGSILSSNVGGNCTPSHPSSKLADNGYNLEDDAGAACGFSAAAHDLVGVHPLLGALANNGGPVQTMTPATNSPAIDVIPNPTSDLCPGTDARAIARPQGPRCDIGAVEVANVKPIVTLNPGSRTAIAGHTLTFTAAASGLPKPTAQWQVSSDGGATYANISGATSSSLSFTAVASQNNRRYRAVFHNSLGSATTNAATLTVQTPPGAPTAPIAHPGNAGATVSWTAPATNGGVAVSGYVVTPYLAGVAQTARTFASSATTELVTGLMNGKSYTFKIAAKNAAGIGAQSTASAPIVVGAPAAPTAVGVVKIASGQIKASFTPGANNGASPTYTATCTSSNGGTPKSKSGAASPLIVVGLTAGKTYTCNVRGANSRGTGPASKPSAAVTA